MKKTKKIIGLYAYSLCICCGSDSQHIILCHMLLSLVLRVKTGEYYGDKIATYKVFSTSASIFLRHWSNLYITL